MTAIPNDGKASVLIIEDDLALAQLYVDYLRNEPYDVRMALTGGEGIELAEEEPPDLVVLDVRLPDISGLDVLAHARDRDWPATIVVVTAHGTVDVAIAAMQAGAADFLTKPFDDERFVVTLRNALDRHRLSRIVDTYRETLDRQSFAGLMGGSLPMLSVYRMIESAAQSAASVFITGESGTGKELCARALHDEGPRAGRPFIAINCGAIPRELLESEIFGHVKGAFTGAVADREGAAAQADGGTLFLDEICELSLDLQVKLLRFIQTGQFRKVGGNTTETVDVRFVSATNRDPLEEVAAGRMREDLFYRLHVVPIHMPPLRERGDDIVMLAEHFLAGAARAESKTFTGIADDARTAILGHDWPGNVRQMDNVIRTAVVLGDGPLLTAAMLEPALKIDRHGTAQAVPAPAPAAERPAIRPMWQVEMEAIDTALEACGGNVVRAAAALEISPATLYRRLKNRKD